MSAYKDKLRLGVYLAVGKFLKAVDPERTSYRLRSFQAFHYNDDGENGLEIVWGNGETDTPKVRRTHGTIYAAFTGPYFGRLLVQDISQELLAKDRRLKALYSDEVFREAIAKFLYGKL